ncbi:prepilin peptidase [Nocardiopsis sp. HNM0947]|uniref:Prepilin peptidase n=1 Tax=Nocardiopsis coralli TaxID=2772213 RepID=A0ABR9P0M0_9ACTN|nr:A24 family peptidase [Nocardiopsis coralli]MBE2997378.1 prepilin peptidase [Nocardiopsis coralli]
MLLPSELTLVPDTTTVAVGVVFGVLGVLTGRVCGRLVPLFGPGRPTPAHPEPAAPRSAMAGDGPRPERSESPLPEDEGPPPPRCPHCLTDLPFPAFLPALAGPGSWWSGACPSCRATVPTHPAVPAVTGILFALAAGAAVQQQWALPDLPPVLWLVAFGVPLSVVDLRVLRLPDPVVGTAYPVAAVLLAAAVLWPAGTGVQPSGDELQRGAEALVSMVLITVLYWLLWRVQPSGLGFGDVKLAGITGLYTGWAAGAVGALAAAFWAFAAFSVVGMALLALRRLTRRQPFPLGPFMLGSTFLTVLVGAPLLP